MATRQPERLKVFTVSSRLGEIRCAEGDEGLVALCLPAHDEDYFRKTVAKRVPGAELVEVAPEETVSGPQLQDYLAGRRKRLDAPVDWRGMSRFSHDVLRQVHGIPYGQSQTYGEVAAAVGRPQAARAVGRAMGANPVPLFVP